MRKTYPDRINLSLSTGQQISVNLRRHGNTRNPKLVIGSDGQVTLRIPKRISRANLEYAIQQLAPLLELEAFLPLAPPQLPVSINIPFLGLAYAVEINQDSCQHATHCLRYANAGHKIQVAMTANKIILSGMDANQDSGLAALQLFFWQFAKHALPPFLKTMCMPEQLAAVRVRNQKSIMGSCSQKPGRKPVINLNWRALFLSEPMLRHLCLHELTHIRHMSHGPDFYDSLEKVSANCKLKEKELNNAWKNLPAWIHWRTRLDQP